MKRWTQAAMFLPILLLMGSCALAFLLKELFPISQIVTLHIPDFLAHLLHESGPSEIRFQEGQRLWMLPIAFLPYLVLTATRGLLDLRLWQILLQLFLRIALVMSLVIAVAMPTILQERHANTLILVVDTSASIDDKQLLEATKILRESMEL